MDHNTGFSRRRMLGRTAVVGGALVWGIPMVQVLDPGRAFAATGSAGPPPPPPPPGHGGHKPTPPKGTKTPTPPTTTVLGETVSQTLPTSVLGETVTATGKLPFTGSALPTKAAVEAGAGLIAGGIVLRTLGARRRTLAGEPAPVAPAVDQPDA